MVVPILHQDPHFLIVDKPAPLLTIPDRFDKAQPSLSMLLRKQWGEVFVVHRLDRETSGAIVFALNEDAHRRLCKMFEAHEVQKVYLALVTGEVPGEAGTIDQPIRENKSRPGTVEIHKSGKVSVTDYRVVERFRGFTLIEARPKSGRLHQVRIHLAFLGHPLAIDEHYGGSQSIYLSSIKRGYRPKADQDERPLMRRLTLHASEITFPHPFTGAVTSATAPFPKDFRSVLNHLRKWT